jgi:hypothetical protein
MRSVRFGLLLFLSLLSFSVGAQQAASPQQGSTPGPTRDSNAIAALNQALRVAGGAIAIGTINDYTASGNVTYHMGQDVQGTVTIKGLGLQQFRVDASLPNGTRTHVMSGGRTQIKAEDGKISSLPLQAPTPGKDPSPIPSSDAFPYQPPKFPGSIAVPLLQLAAVVGDPSFSISFKGTVEVEGHSVLDIQVHPHWPGSIDPMSEYHTSDFFVDPSTFQLVMVQDTVPKHVLHQIWYSDYRPVNGILVPFAISEQMGGQTTWTIQLDQIGFNGGLQDSNFAL